MRTVRATCAATAMALIATHVVGCAAAESSPLPGRASWTVTAPGPWGPVSAATVTGQSVLVKARHGVGVLERADGALRWYHPWPVTGNGASPVSTTSVHLHTDTVITVEPGDDGIRVRGLDLGTGTVHYTRRYRHHAQVGATTTGIVAADCTTSGCTMHRLDPRTGEPAWQATVTAPATLTTAVTVTNRGVDANLDRSITDRVNPFHHPAVTTVVLHQPATATTPGQLTAVDAGTGTTRGQWPARDPRPADPRPSILLPTDTRYLTSTPADGCPQAVTATDTTTGTSAWTTTVGRWPTRYPGPTNTPRCDDLPHLAVTGNRLLAMTPDERPRIIDIRTGEHLWTGPAGAHLLGLANDTAITRTHGRNSSLTAHDTTNGETRWTRPLHGASDITVTPTHVVYTTTTATDHPRITITDATTGKKPRSLGSGRLLGIGAGWAVTGTATSAIDPGNTPTDINLYDNITTA